MADWDADFNSTPQQGDINWSQSPQDTETDFTATPQVSATQDGDRCTGIVKGWTEKGFGFITNDADGDKVFCHIRETPDRAGLTPGSKVSFTYMSDQKGGKATEVLVEEAAEQVTKEREFGTVKRWNSEKGFGFIGRNNGGDDAFCHKKDCGNVDLAAGQAVSFVFEEGAKGAAAKEVREEEGGNTLETVVEEEADDRERDYGRVKSYNDEKGFAFIAPCKGGEDLFSHKREFGGIEPEVGMGVSYILEATDKGDSAKKVQAEDNVPETELSDEGRDFGTVKNWNAEKGFGFIIWKGEENAIAFAKQCNGLTLTPNMTISFVKEDGDKGPIAKDIREEDPARVARVTATLRYGVVKEYSDPTPTKPTNGYGFITPLGPTLYGAPKKYYFHMSEIVSPDSDGGIDIETPVSFIVTPARSGKGVQACAVTVAEPPKESKGEEGTGLEEKIEGWGIDDAGSGEKEAGGEAQGAVAPAEKKAEENDAWAPW